MDAVSDQWLESFNPYTGKPWALIPRATPEDVNRAVASARAAFKSKEWHGLTATARGKLLLKIADLIAARADALGAIETTDNGKLILEMRAQTRYMPEWFHYFAGLADKIEGRVIPIDKPGYFNFTLEEPLGVVAAITPWNSPLMLAAWKLAPALAAGNTVVLEAVRALVGVRARDGRHLREAGLPARRREHRDRLRQRDRRHARRASATSRKSLSPAATRPAAPSIRQAATRIKPVTMELGGKSANIVFDDAALDNAVKGVVSGIFAATGQTCVAGSRALIHKSIHDAVRRAVPAARAHGAHGQPAARRRRRSGPSRPSRNTRRCSATSTSPRARRRLACSAAGPHAVPSSATVGSSSRPMFTGVTPDMRIAQEEVFGPVLSIIPFDRRRRGDQIANGTIYGLAPGVWTASINRALNDGRTRSKPAPCGSTPTACRARCRRSAATSARASAARADYSRSASSCRRRASGSK